MFELVAGVPPFIASNREDLRKNIERGKIMLPPGLEISPACLNLIHKLL